MRYLISLGLLLALCATPATAQTVKVCANLAAPGCSCSVTANNIGYGSVPVDQLSSHLSASGLITISCTASGQTSVSILGNVQLNIPYSIALGPTTNRQLTNGKALSSTMTIITVAVSLGSISLSFPLTTANNIPYALLSPSGGGLASGLYSDTVTITVSY